MNTMTGFPFNTFKYESANCFCKNYAKVHVALRRCASKAVFRAFLIYHTAGCPGTTKKIYIESISEILPFPLLVRLRLIWSLL